MGLEGDPCRLVVETEAMRERWGDGARLRRAGGKLGWDVAVRVEGRELPIRIVYPEGYPGQAPEIEVRRPLRADTPHLLGGRRLCWRYSGDRRDQNRWEPARDTAALLVGVAYLWWAAYLVWEATGSWPVPDAR